MTEREIAMKKVAETCFAAMDAELFCDTHPTNKQAITYFQNKMRMAVVAKNEYAQKYGPIMLSQQNNADYFDWVESPWPWEVSE